MAIIVSTKPRTRLDFAKSRLSNLSPGFRLGVKMGVRTGALLLLLATQATANDDCLTKGFTTSLRCASCAKLSAIVKDEGATRALVEPLRSQLVARAELHSDCLACCSDAADMDAQV